MFKYSSSVKYKNASSLGVKSPRYNRETGEWGNINVLAAMIERRNVNTDIQPKDKSYGTKYPRTTKVLQQLYDYVAVHPSVLSTLVEYTGYSSAEVLQQLSFKKSKMILTIEDLSWHRLSPEGITLSATDIRVEIRNINGLEKAKTNEKIQALSFLIAVIILHEFVHAARKANKKDKNGEKDEMGWGWELRVFGKTINNENAKTSYKEFDWNFKY